MPTKGQKLSKEAILKMKESKKKKLLSKYNWIIAEPYFDQEINNGGRNRNKKFIILREFKNAIEEGRSIKELQQEGISKNILQFFSNFCQGKIKLTKDEFIGEYKKGNSLEEISKKYNVTREDVTFLRQLYNIKIKGATFIKRKETEVFLTEEQKQLIYGSLMGDAKRQHSQFLSSVGFVQGEIQKEYLLWKFHKLSNLVSENSLSREETYDKRYKKNYYSWRFYTLANTDVENILVKFYKDGEKKITNDILDNLTDLSLAVWFMDDGYADKYNDEITNLIFCTDSFSRESCDLIVEWFKNKYSIRCYMRKKKSMKNDILRYRIIISKESVPKLISIIKPHILPMFYYKIGE